eukprot:2676262-Prymnesium_polylepis.1
MHTHTRAHTRTRWRHGGVAWRAAGCGEGRVAGGGACDKGGVAGGGRVTRVAWREHRGGRGRGGGDGDGDAEGRVHARAATRGSGARLREEEEAGRGAEPRDERVVARHQRGALALHPLRAAPLVARALERVLLERPRAAVVAAVVAAVGGGEWHAGRRAASADVLKAGLRAAEAAPRALRPPDEEDLAHAALAQHARDAQL